MPAATRARRAAPLAPAERRAAIISATLPLLRTHGLAITSRQIAEAAGVAEGTVFSVFDDKDSVIAAAVESALDPAPTVAQLAEIDPTLELRPRLIQAVEILQTRVVEVWQLISAVGPGSPGTSDRSPHDASDANTAALAALVQADGHRLQRPTDDVARALLGATLGCSHPAVLRHPLAPDEIVDLVLHGVLRTEPTEVGA
ncbi:MAG: TetR/AcrR family transcriptional regulator [Acidimicrobiales bacterium]